MAVPVPTERRAFPRRGVGISARLHHDTSGKDFPCRCVDVSPGGASLIVPANMPIRPGHEIRLTPSADTEEMAAELIGRDLTATVVRVDREALLKTGQLSVGIAFLVTE